VTESISISKQCKAIKVEYQTNISFDIKSGVEKTTSNLPFQNIGDEDSCGVKKIELIDVENSEIVSLSSTCEDALKCNKVDI